MKTLLWDPFIVHQTHHRLFLRISHWKLQISNKITHTPRLFWGVRTWHLNGILYILLIPREVLEVIHNTQMEQLVTFPTRGMNILDLCLTTHSSIISTYKPIPGLSDHDAVFMNLSLSLHRIKSPM